LLRGDIPNFDSKPNATDLCIDGDLAVSAYFAVPAFSKIAAQIRAASHEDKAQQLSFVRLALRSQAMNRRKHETGALRRANGKAQTREMPVDSAELINRALEIGDLVLDLAVSASDSSATWLGVQFDRATRAYKFAEVDDGLFDGRSGIALFLAALSRVSGKPKYADFLIEHILPSYQNREQIYGTDPHNYRHVGLYSGISGIVYAMGQLAQLLGMPDLLTQGISFAHTLNEQSIVADDAFDLIIGSAGTISGLLSIYALNPDERVLDVARRSGEHLLANRTVTATGLRSWATMQGRCLTGFSHGVAGIAYALFKLAAVTGDEHFFDAAVEAITYENQLYSADYSNWPDYRDNLVSYTSNDSWCNGAPGIGLGRLLSLPYYDTPAMQRDIDRSIHFMKQLSRTNVDHMCCGNWGRISVLTSIGHARPDKHTLDYVMNEVGELLRPNGGVGIYRVSAEFHPMFRLGFFQGLSGIGYALLRLYQPDLPDILAFQ
jgi:type 2 lantibiotic biosynthesis protein LanM